jgi:hypothetical protein
MIGHSAIVVCQSSPDICWPYCWSLWPLTHRPETVRGVPNAAMSQKDATILIKTKGLLELQSVVLT